jgi:hypothetical protein
MNMPTKEQARFLRSLERPPTPGGGRLFRRPVVAGGEVASSGPVVDLVRNFGAPAGGGDATAAFTAWKAFGAANPNSTLTIPAGSFTGVANGQIIIGCVGNVSVIGTPSSVAGALPLTKIPALWVGTDNTAWFAPEHCSYIQTVSAGSNNVVLLNPAHASRFAIGGRVLVAGLTNQGGSLAGGYPPNTYNFEYARVSAVNGATVFLNKPLRYAYKSTWPEAVVTVPTTGATELGPAQIVWLPAITDQNITLKNIYVTNAPNPTDDVFFYFARNVLFDNMAFDGRGPATSIVETFEARNSPKIGENVEPDKLVEVIRYKSCRNGSIAFQSASCRDVYFENCTDIYIGGGGRNTYIYNCTLNANGVQPGCGYGQCNTYQMNNVRIASAGLGPVWALLDYSQWSPYFNGATKNFIKPITSTDSGAGYQHMIEGVKCCLAYYDGSAHTHADQDGKAHGFTVTNVRTDGTNFIVDTNIVASTLPTNLTFQGVNPPNRIFFWPIQPGPFSQVNHNYDWLANWPMMPDADMVQI